MKTFIATQTASALRIPSRKQAIEDGALIDLSENPTIKLHCTMPFACTFAVWLMIQANLKNTPSLQLDELIRKISISAKIATLLYPHRDELALGIVIGSDNYALRLRIAPDEDAKQAATLSLLNED